MRPGTLNGDPRVQLEAARLGTHVRPPQTLLGRGNIAAADRINRASTQGYAAYTMSMSSQAWRMISMLEGMESPEEGLGTR